MNNTRKRIRLEKSIKIQPDCWIYISALRDSLNQKLGIKLGISETLGVLKNKFSPDELSEILLKQQSQL